MYVLTFKENRSKYFPEALGFAKELGGVCKNGIVRVEISDILNAYRQIRTLFSFIQNWKGTAATYLGKPVHPYQFLLHVHWIGECYDQRIVDKNCGGGWSCLKIDNLRYHIPEKYYPSHKFWYSYGHFSGSRWIIDKEQIFSVLFSFAEGKGITACPFFDETKLQRAVFNLPSFLVPDDITFGVVYKEQYIEGQLVRVRAGIRHLDRREDSAPFLLGRNKDSEAGERIESYFLSLYSPKILSYRKK